MNLFTYLKQAPIGFESQDMHYEPHSKSQPTCHPPGSLDKVRVLAARLENGQDLWHPDDAVDYSGCKGGLLAIHDPAWKETKRTKARPSEARRGF